MGLIPALLGFSGLGVPEIFVLLMVFVAGTGLWIWTLIDCLTKEADTGNTKLVWVAVIAITHVLGAALYLLVRRPERVAGLGR
jgi:hypothetical protein